MTEPRPTHGTPPAVDADLADPMTEPRPAHSTPPTAEADLADPMNGS